jgi:translation initiation factor IF-3
MLKGRENQYAEIAQEKMESFVKSLSEIYKLEGQIKKSGNTFNAMLKPIK